MTTRQQTAQEQIEDRSSKEALIEQIFHAIMELPEEARNRIHKKYLERYGWYVE